MNRRGAVRNAGALSLTMVALAAVAGCSVEPADFASKAENFIQGDEVSQWASGLTFTGAACTEPTDTKVNTEFQCTAAGSDGSNYVFLVKITGQREFRVETIQPG